MSALYPTLDPGPSMDAILFADWLGKPAWMWLAFSRSSSPAGFRPRRPPQGTQGNRGRPRASCSRRLYIGLGLAVRRLGLVVSRPEPGMDYLTGFAVEKTLAMDNVFVIAMIFAYLRDSRRATSTACCSGASSASSCCARS